MQTFIFKYLLGQKGALGKHQPFPPVYHNSTKAWAPASYSTQKYHCIEFQICTVSTETAQIFCAPSFFIPTVLLLPSQAKRVSSGRCGSVGQKAVVSTSL